MVDWRDKHFSSEPGRRRPAIVVDSSLLINLRVLTIVSLTGDVNLAPPSFSVRIDPARSNGLKKPSYALVWNVQTVAVERTATTRAVVTGAQVSTIRGLLAEFFSASPEDG